jgi:hypothetical protein
MVLENLSGQYLVQYQAAGQPQLKEVPHISRRWSRRDGSRVYIEGKTPCRSPTGWKWR